MDLIRKLWSMFTSRERFQSFLLLVALLVGSLLEALAVGITVPFVSVISDPSESRHPLLLKILQYFNITPTQNFVVLSAIGVVLLYLFKNAYLAALTYLQNRFVNNGYASLSCRLLNAYLNAPWTFHLQRNSAELLRNITMEMTLLFYNVLSPLIVLATEVLVVSAIVLLLVLVDPISSVTALVFLGGMGIGFYRMFRRKTDQLGQEQQQTRGDIIKWVNQALGGIKETKVLGKEDFFRRKYAAHSSSFARANTYVSTIGQLPRFFFETLIVSGILLVSAVLLMRGQQATSLLATLALFGAAAYRLMPSINRFITSVTSIQFHRPTVYAVHKDLCLLESAKVQGRPLGDILDSKLPFMHRIEVHGVSFHYPEVNRDVLSRVSLTIPKGYSVAFTGPSGAGKTTLADIVLGLLEPSAGQILVDGFDILQNLGAWQRQIGYIPQSIYLSDDTVRRNVAFGVEDDEIDDAKVWAALGQAQLEELVRELPEGLETSVGERGVRLSGGQRQRIGIARALYHDPEVLVLDEATSSLDSETEEEITQAIDRLSRKKTLIIIAHRLSTVEKCDVRYEIKSGKIEYQIQASGVACE